jgi:hypothetical protein
MLHAAALGVPLTKSRGPWRNPVSSMRPDASSTFRLSQRILQCQSRISADLFIRILER